MRLLVALSVLSLVFVPPASAGHDGEKEYARALEYLVACDNGQRSLEERQVACTAALAHMEAAQLKGHLQLPVNNTTETVTPTPVPGLGVLAIVVIGTSVALVVAKVRNTKKEK